MPALAVALSKVNAGLPDVGIVHDVEELNEDAPVYSFPWLKLDSEKRVMKIKTSEINKSLRVPVRAIVVIGDMVLQGFRSLNYL